jgi:hypothetical protein
LLAEQVKDSFLLLEDDAAAEEIDCGQQRVERRRCSCDLSLIDKASESGRLCRDWYASKRSATT